MLNGTTLRIFKNRTKVDKVCLMKGKLPEKTGEIAIDRMYADNNKLSVGDSLQSGKRKLEITGLVLSQITVPCFKIIMIQCLMQ